MFLTLLISVVGMASDRPANKEACRDGACPMPVTFQTNYYIQGSASLTIVS